MYSNQPIKVIFFAGLFLLSASLVGEQASLLDNRKPASGIVINNRVLVNINNKPISLLDLTKKLDMIFYKEYPHYVSNPEARYEFYRQSWKPMLKDYVERELILEDAKKVQMAVSNGDVRMELEKLFGPNVIANLDKAGFTLDEASKMVREDILIRRMMFLKVYSKVEKQVTPAVLKEEYKKYIKEYVPQDEWTYQVITIKDPNPQKLEELAKSVHSLLVDKATPLDQLSYRSKKLPEYTSFSNIRISEVFSHKQDEISSAYKKNLVSLRPGSFSEPVKYQREDSTILYRIFYVKDLKIDEYPRFNQVAGKIKNRLSAQLSDVESEKYLSELKQEYSVSDDQIEEVLSDQFQPFILK